jgi:cell division protein FtsX
MTSSGRPSAVSRLRRNSLASLGVVVVGCLAIGSAGLSDALHVRLTSQVDANWRGAFDILVRPSGGRLDLEDTRGLIEPNFLSFSGHGGISVDQLRAIRSIGGVELAAPLGFLGYLRYTTSAPTIQLTELPARPTLYQATVTMTTSDGLADRVLQRETGRVLVGPAPSDPGSETHFAADFNGITYGVDASGNPLVDISANHQLPSIAIPVMAVDPAAERALLGPTAGFLEDLEHITGRDKLTVSTIDMNLIPPAFDFSRTQIMLLRDPKFPNKAAKNRPIVPIVVSEHLYAGLKVTLDVSQIGQALASYPPGDTQSDELDAAARSAGGGTTEVGHTLLDAGAELRPFQPANITVAWPGSSALGGATTIVAFDALETRLTVRPSYTAVSPLPDSGRPSFRMASLGFVGPDDNPVGGGAAPDDPTASFIEGALPAYRSFKSVPLAIDGSGVDSSLFDSPFIFAPLGTFDLAKLDLPTNPLSHVPLGAYEVPKTTLVADPSGTPVAPKAMTLSSAGLLASPPLAITDLAAALLLRGQSPIDVVRVRVAGLTGFDSAAQAKVEAVASQIAAMGFDVDIVAGSSPQAIDLYVPEYNAATNPPSDLGWVRQEWTTIGAAQRIERGFSTTNITLLALALLSALVFSVGLQVVQLGRRTQEIAILRAIGWARGAILRWMVAEALVAAVVIALLAIAGWWLGGRSLVVLVAGQILAGIWLLGCLVGTLVAERSAIVQRIDSGEVSTGPSPFFRMPVKGIPSLALRWAIARPSRTCVEIVGLATAGTAVSLSVVSVALTASHSGPTLLAAAVGESLGPLQLMMLSASAAGSVAFALAAARLDLSSRRPDLEVLRATGWSDESIRWLFSFGRVLVALPAAILAAIGAWVLGTGLQLASSLFVAVIFAAIVSLVMPVAVTWLGLRPTQ